MISVHDPMISLLVAAIGTLGVLAFFYLIQD